MRILIIDNNIDPRFWGSAELRHYAKLAQGATVHVRRAPHDDLPASPLPYDRIIVSGSKTSALEDAPWIFRLQDFVRQALDAGKPYLGVCYGHQTLARALAGRDTVRKGTTPEFGWSRIEVLVPSPLFEGLPPEFHTYSSHFEEVHKLPPGMKQLARSEACEIQACQLEDRPVFGIQFHPERTLEGAKESLAEHQKKPRSLPLLHADRSEELFDPRVGEKIFGNFLRI
ncbi:MAG: type 1 glutamine amidotransferase [Oligoflexia bacterium]|nr:type 1 glutamine amidotransferase [Oligoflexia bacterium]